MNRGRGTMAVYSRRNSRNTDPAEAAMTLHFIAKDPETNGDHCPTVWYDDDTHEFVIQGWKPEAELLAKCLEAGPIPSNEAVVRLPARMTEVLKEAVDVAARAAVR